MIKVSHLTKKYGKTLAVDDISFEVEGGSIYGFLGPNGAGKSTTMNIITGCLAPTEGEILIDDISMLDDPVAAKRLIGYLPETPPLYSDMTPWEYLRFVAEAKGVRRDRIADEVTDVMAATGVADVKDRLIRNLSKGYRQRVGIAQAMVGDPDIIILDEPTEGLDPQQRTEIRALINDLGRDRTVILSSHVLSEVQEICDKIIVISHGKLVANDTMENISRSLTSETTMLLTVKATPEETAAVIGGVDGVSSFEIVDGADDGTTSAKVKYASSRDMELREAISFAFSDIRRAVLSMSVEEENLEDIFLKLTSTKDTDENDADDANDAADSNESDEADGDAEADDGEDDEYVVYDPADYLGDDAGGVEDKAADDDDDDDDNDDGGDDYKPLFGGK